MAKRLPKGTTVTETQQLAIVRCITRVIGKKRYTFWKADGGEMFIGRGCHMRALSNAIALAPVKTRTFKATHVR